MIISDTDSLAKPENPDLGVPGREDAKVNKGCDMELGFLENIAIFTFQTKGLKKGFLALKPLSLDSFLMS